MTPLWEHQAAVDARRQFEAHQEAIADIHRLGEERREAREAQEHATAIPVIEPLDDRVHRDGFFTRF